VLLNSFYQSGLSGTAPFLDQEPDTGDKKGKLWVFDFRENKLFNPNPHGVALETNFNKIDLPGYAPDHLEKMFADKIEQKAVSVLRWICANNDIPSDEDFSYVLNLLTLFAVRNPAMRRSMTASKKHAYRVIGDLLASDRRLYEHHAEKARERGFIAGADVPFELMQETLRADFELQISPQEHLATELAVFKSILEGVSARYWSLLIAAPDAPDFITCDHPASVVYKQCVFPIGPRHALMGDRENPAPARIILPTAGVAEVNARIADLADRQIYARLLEVTILVEREVVTIPLAQLEFAGKSRAMQSSLATFKDHGRASTA
jgi:hypothetical protein